MVAWRNENLGIVKPRKDISQERSSIRGKPVMFIKVTAAKQSFCPYTLDQVDNAYQGVA